MYRDSNLSDVGSIIRANGSAIWKAGQYLTLCSIVLKPGTYIVWAHVMGSSSDKESIISTRIEPVDRSDGVETYLRFGSTTTRTTLDSGGCAVNVCGFLITSDTTIKLNTYGYELVNQKTMTYTGGIYAIRLPVF